MLRSYCFFSPNFSLAWKPQVEDDLQRIHDASNQEELVHFYKQYGKNIVDLSQHAQRRQQVELSCAHALSFADKRIVQGLGRPVGTGKLGCRAWNN
jgi:hypothetical protein